MNDITANKRQASWKDLILVLCLALAFRLPAALIELDHHADEIWQYLEQAYGIVFGRAVVPWEYRAHIRTWLLPTFLAGPLWLGAVLMQLGVGLLVPVRLVCAIASLSIVASAFLMADRLSRRHAIMVGLIMAASFELAYFGARALSDSIAVALFMPSAVLLKGSETKRQGALWAGMLLGFCFCVRFQLAPAIAVLVLLSLPAKRQIWGCLIIGGLLALTVDGIIDLANGDAPFQWMINNVWMNIVVNRSARYGVEPSQWYVVEQFRLWLWAFPIVIALALLGCKKFPALFVAASVNVIFHSFIPHKEYRFVLLSVTIVMFLAAVGSADLVERFSTRTARAKLLTFLAAFWISVSATAALSPAGKQQWNSFKRVTGLMRAAHREQAACGLAFFQPGNALAAAHIYLDRNIPIYVFKDGDDVNAVTQRARTFNLLVTSPDRIRNLEGKYVLKTCFPLHARKASSLPYIPDRCLYVRPGTCDAATDHRYDINRVLQDQDQ